MSRCTIVAGAGCLVLMLLPLSSVQANETATEGRDRTPVAKEAAASHAESVTLIAPARLEELERARHRQLVAVEYHLPAAKHISALWSLGGALMLAALLALVLWRTGLARSFGIASKMYLGFGVVALLAVGIGAGGYVFLNAVARDAWIAGTARGLDTVVERLGVLQNEYIIVGMEDKARGEEIRKEHDELFAELDQDLAALRARDLDEGYLAGCERFEREGDDYAKTFAALVQAFEEVEVDKDALQTACAAMDQRIGALVREHEEDLRNMEQRAADAAVIAAQTLLIENLLQAQLLSKQMCYAQVQFMLDKDVARVHELERDLGTARSVLATVHSHIAASARDEQERASDLAMLTQTQTAVEEFQHALARVIESDLDVDGDLVTTQQQLKDFDTTVGALTARADTDAELAHHEANEVAVTLMVLAAAIGGALANTNTRGITRPVARVVTGLSSGAEQVTEASQLVSRSSQAVAEGNSEQASALEESSSALEQLAAQTQANAGHANEANVLALRARERAGSGEETMTRLNSAMVGINDSASQIQKIIKVIEGIAFQTNLRALNAAGEAARAGEHGKGFAVVAEEVRNLSLRCATAAQDTTALIEGAVTRAQEGKNVADAASAVLQGIAGDVGQVAELLGSITRASSEQARGVDQINTAVAQMDKAVQNNAAGSEEAASAAEELTAQATALKAMVTELVRVVRGGRTSIPQVAS